ncbi:MAG TPA: Hpt domain-containing protein, partial [Holophaga sp.]|nr:Hpt domain-containing protein [Holophaga sp.]
MADTFPDALKALQEAFARDVPIRIAELRQTWEDPALGDETRLQTLHQLAHRLAGAAGTFGLGSLGEACRA